MCEVFYNGRTEEDKKKDAAMAAKKKTQDKAKANKEMYEGNYKGLKGSAKVQEL
jgi:hypothetical protein